MSDEELQDQLDDQNDDEQQEDAELAEEAAEPSFEEKIKESIDVNVEDLGSLRKKLTVTVPRDTITDRLSDQYDELRRDATVPGFRRGRAPRRLLEKRFGSEVASNLSQQLLSSSYLAAVEKTDLKVIGDPLVWVDDDESEGHKLADVQEAMDKIELPENGDLTYACEIEVRPEFDLPELEGIPVEKPVITVEDENVDEQINRLLQMRGDYQTIEDGAVEKDDLIQADVKMTSGDTVLKEEEGVNLAARPQVIDGVPLEKLGDELAGARAGDVRKITAEIGDDYYREDFRGKPAEFEIKINEIRRLKLPELDDEFAKSVGFESVDELREYVRNDLESRIGQEVRRGMMAQVRKYLLDNTDFELPERLSERQTARMVTQRILDMYRRGIPQAEAEKQMDEVRTSAKEEVARDLKLAFIMEKLAEDNDVEVTEGEINGQIAMIAQYQGARFDRVRDQLIKQGGLENLYLQIRDEKLIGQLLDKANVTEKAPSAEPAAEKEDADDKKDQEHTDET